jgi:hypothetical protein
MSSTYAVLGLSMAAAGPLTSSLGGRWIWGIGGAACIVAGFAAAALVPRLRGVVSPLEAELQSVEPVAF